MFGWLNSRAREIRQLNKDAATIVEMARQTYRSELQRAIALQLRDGIRQVADLCDGNATCMEQQLHRLKTQHREARSRHDQVGLTAYTLVIIYVRALLAGDECAPARGEIDGYVAEWAHAAEDGGVLPG